MASPFSAEARGGRRWEGAGRSVARPRSKSRQTSDQSNTILGAAHQTQNTRAASRASGPSNIPYTSREWLVGCLLAITSLVKPPPSFDVAKPTTSTLVIASRPRRWERDVPVKSYSPGSPQPTA
ncbi:hypothetical protein BS78_03G266400 [Paspalum vaginatum]|nr:hypothetical protein BS78_03G266400 [Paspalum vaginatum]